MIDSPVKTPIKKRKNPEEQIDTFCKHLEQTTPLKTKCVEKRVRLTFDEENKENPPTNTPLTLNSLPLYQRMQKSAKEASFSPITMDFLSSSDHHLRSRGDIPKAREELLKHLEKQEVHQRSPDASPLAWRFNPDHDFRLVQCTYNESTHRWYTNEPTVKVNPQGRPSFEKDGQLYLGCDDILTIVTPDEAKHKIWIMRQKEKIALDNSPDIDLIQSQLLNTPPELLDIKEIAVRVKTRDLAHRDANKQRKPNPKTFFEKKTANESLNDQLEHRTYDTERAQSILSSYDHEFAQFHRSFAMPLSAEYVHFLGRGIMPTSPTRTAIRMNQEEPSYLERLIYENGQQVINSQFPTNFGVALRGHNTKQLIMETLITNMVEHRADQQQDTDHEAGVEVIVRVTTQKENNIPLQVVIGFLDPVTNCFIYQNNCEPLRTERPCDIRKALTDVVKAFLENYDRQHKPLASFKKS